MIHRPGWFGVDFEPEHRYTWLCLAALVLTAAVVHRLRNTGVAGRWWRSATTSCRRRRCRCRPAARRSGVRAVRCHRRRRRLPLRRSAGELHRGAAGHRAVAQPPGDGDPRRCHHGDRRDPRRTLGAGHPLRLRHQRGAVLVGAGGARGAPAPPERPRRCGLQAARLAGHAPHRRIDQPAARGGRPRTSRAAAREGGRAEPRRDRRRCRGAGALVLRRARAVRRQRGRRRGLDPRSPRRGGRAARPERCRQDHVVRRAVGAPAPDVRIRGAARGRRHHVVARAARPARAGADLPTGSALQRAHGARSGPGRARTGRAERGGAVAPGLPPVDPR